MSARGCLGGGGVYLGGCLPRGCLPGGEGVAAQRVVHLHPVNRITDTCKNITLRQLRCGR